MIIDWLMDYGCYYCIFFCIGWFMVIMLKIINLLLISLKVKCILLLFCKLDILMCGEKWNFMVVVFCFYLGMVLWLIMVVWVLWLMLLIMLLIIVLLVFGFCICIKLEFLFDLEFIKNCVEIIMLLFFNKFDKILILWLLLWFSVMVIDLKCFLFKLMMIWFWLLVWIIVFFVMINCGLVGLVVMFILVNIFGFSKLFWLVKCKCMWRVWFFLLRVG